MDTLLNMTIIFIWIIFSWLFISALVNEPDKEQRKYEKRLAEEEKELHKTSTPLFTLPDSDNEPESKFSHDVMCKCFKCGKTNNNVYIADDRQEYLRCPICGWYLTSICYVKDAKKHKSIMDAYFDKDKSEEA